MSRPAPVPSRIRPPPSNAGVSEVTSPVAQIDMAVPENNSRTRPDHFDGVSELRYMVSPQPLGVAGLLRLFDEGIMARGRLGGKRILGPSCGPWRLKKRRHRNRRAGIGGRQAGIGGIGGRHIQFGAVKNKMSPEFLIEVPGIP